MTNPRLRILELPTVADPAGYRIPWVFVFDRVGTTFDADTADVLASACRTAGAEACLMFATEVDVAGVIAAATALRPGWEPADPTSPTD